MIDKLIKDMKEKGLMSVAPIRFIGRAGPTFDMLVIMATTKPEETDLDWWILRLWLGRN